MKRTLLFLLLSSLAPACTESADDPVVKATAVLAAARAKTAVKAKDAPAEAAPVIAVEPRKDKIDGYPCHECHDDTMKPDNTVRVLKEAHTDVVLVHGGGRFWCTTCHGADKDALVNLKGERVDFDEQYLMCGQCHFRQQREFLHGGHGKHLEMWRGERKVAACTSCHDAHDPSFKPKKPWRGPDAKR